MTHLFSPHFQATDSSGNPVAGALLYFYQTGTTTPITTYQDSGKVTPSTTVQQSDLSLAIVADASGLFAPIYVDTTSYKIVLKTSALITIQTIDPVLAPVTGDSTVNFASGTVSLPSITFTGDLDTGLYRVGANDFGLVAGGALQAEITSNGLQVKDTKFSIIDNADASKIAVFEAGALATATTRTYTLPDASGTIALTSVAVASPTQLAEPVNVALLASVGSSALTIALKGVDGNDPSASNPVYVRFRNVTAATGTPEYLTVTTATSLVISSGSTMGFANATAGRLWIVGFNDAGTFRLGAVNCLSGTSIMSLRNDIASSTAEGGAGAADSAQVFYTGTAVTSKAFAVLGWMEWSAGLTTAGTWAIVPTKIKLFQPGDSMPGDTVQTARNDTGAVATGTTAVPNDDTIPQNTEGDQYMSQAITPTSAANLLYSASNTFLANSANGTLVASLFRDSTANALVTAFIALASSGALSGQGLSYTALAGATTSTTFKVRGGAASGTTTFNGVGGSRKLGGALNSFIEVREIMA